VPASYTPASYTLTFASAQWGGSCEKWFNQCVARCFPLPPQWQGRCRAICFAGYTICKWREKGGPGDKPPKK
jgi:hypothetical protein